MKHYSTDRWAIMLSIVALAILRFLYWRMGGAVTVPTAAVVDNSIDNEGDENVKNEVKAELPEWYTYLQWNDYTNTKTVSEFWWEEVITRATSTPFLARYWYISKLDEKSWSDDCTFPDIVNKSNDLQKTIRVACAYDLLRWSNGNFIPDRVMSKDELLTVLVRTKTWFLAEDANPWFKNYFDRAQNNWLIEAGTNIADFSWNVTKADLWQRLYKLSLLD